MWLFCFVLKLFLSRILAYNLDVTNAKVYTIPERLQGERNSYFGYATALYRSSENISAILIGAPRANASYSQSMLEPGAVYVCPLNNECKEWIIDKSSNGLIPYKSSYRHNYWTNQIRNNSWVGAVIVTEKSINPRVMVCAPRWLNANKDQWFINGMCYWTMTTGMKSFSKEAKHKVFPASNNEDQFHSRYTQSYYDHAMAQIGISAHVTNSNELGWDVVLGAPGVFLWTGTPMLLKGSNYNSAYTIIPEHRSTRLFSTFDYFGYSVTSGHYEKGKYLYASGSPRGSNMHGHVIIYNFPDSSKKSLDIKYKVKGKQYGEYFGAALASCDLTNDGKDNLIVGAPLWSKDVDEGRVYIYHAWETNMETQIIEGEISGGRFGSTISCLGDIDYDGYGDIVIAAPYEKDSGAIYVYNGNKDGVFPKYSQKILGSQFSENTRGFGISISEPQDINHDKYLDIAVGAYLSEQVILLTSKPVITIKVNFEESDEKLLRDTKFFNISICTIYNGEYAPKKLDIIRILEVDSLYRRASYDAVESNNLTYILPAKLNITEKQCDTFEILLKDDIQNVIDPILVSVVVDLNHTMQEINEKSTKNASHVPSVVINKLYSKIEDSIKLSFVIECGEDNICESDLQIFLLTNLKSNNTYIIGSKSNLELTINVYNTGEPAYQTEVHITLPDPLSLASINPKCTELPWISNNLHVICSVGNPLITNESITLELDTSKVHFDVKNLTLYANTTTQSEEKNLLDNNFNITIYLDTDIDIAIAGKTQEDLYSYFQNDEENKIHPESIRFQHIYEVQNFGVSPITEAVLMVEIPTHWINNDDDIELISINQTTTDRVGNFVKCIDKSYSKSSRISTIETSDEFNMNNVLIESSTENVTKDKLQEKSTLKEATLTNVPPENRTLFINCTNPKILCKQFKCELNSFTNSLSVVKLIFTLDLKISNIQLLTLENKDIIYYASKGAVSIIQPPNIIQASTNKPDTAVITTTFLGAPKKERVAGWILALSIFSGILLLILIILGLLKLGFFNRRKKEELEALKAMTNQKGPIILETSSSEVVLNQE